MTLYDGYGPLAFPDQLDPALIVQTLSTRTLVRIAAVGVDPPTCPGANRDVEIAAVIRELNVRERAREFRDAAGYPRC